MPETIKNEETKAKSDVNESTVGKTSDTAKKKTRRKRKAATKVKPENYKAEFEIKAGAVYETSLILLYKSSVAPTHFKGISGKFYIWDSEVVNGRVRLTDSLSGVGVPELVIGWVKLSNIKGLTVMTDVKIPELTNENGIAETIKEDITDDVMSEEMFNEFTNGKGEE